jgi:LytS/YehU family sensor histidine kinase
MLTAKLQMQAEQDRLDRQLSETRLRLLQAQIEPHFLFNTLGAVQQLAQNESPRAAELTANLITFLRASLGDMRTEQVTLQAELNLIEAYLKVMKTRLGNRLQFSLSLPPALALVQLPGMLVLTLVENAIKHGIEPALRGGAIDVVVTDQGTHFQIDVRDTGAGESLPTTLGVGLSNVKERLQLAYGTAGSFTLQTQEPSGMLATLRLPLAPTHTVSP